MPLAAQLCCMPCSNMCGVGPRSRVCVHINRGLLSLETALFVLLLLQELQAFYATHLAPSSSSRRKLCVHVVPTSSKGSKAATATGSAALGAPGGGEQQQPQEHVQHEFGVLHPHGQHTQHGRQGGGEGDNNQEAAAAAHSGDTPKSKRMRRHQQQEEQQPLTAAAEEGVGAHQVAPVELVPDINAFRASAKRFDAYSSVQPELTQLC